MSGKERIPSSKFKGALLELQTKSMIVQLVAYNERLFLWINCNLKPELSYKYIYELSWQGIILSVVSENFSSNNRKEPTWNLVMLSSSPTQTFNRVSKYFFFILTGDLSHSEWCCSYNAIIWDTSNCCTILELFQINWTKKESNLRSVALTYL